MNRPGGLLAVESERGHKQTPLGFCALKKKLFTVVGKNQRDRLRGLEARVLVNFDIEQIAVIRREKRMEDGMVRENKLKSLGSFGGSFGGGLSLKAQLAQKAIDGRRHPIHEQDHAAPVRKITPEQLSGVTGLQEVALEAEDFGVRVGVEFLADACRFDKMGRPLAAHDLR